MASRGVDRLHEVPDHAVRRDRHLVRGQLGHPLLEPGLAGRLDFRRRGAVAGRARACTEILDRVDELAQHQLGVAEDRVVGGVVLVEVALVVGGVDDALCRRDVRGHAVLGEAAPDAEDDVGLGQEVEDGPGHHAAAAGAERQRVVLREGALALQGGHHRRLQQLGQLHAARRWPRRTARPARRGSPAARASTSTRAAAVDVAGIAGGDGRLHRPVVSAPRSTRPRRSAHVGGDLDHHRPRPAHLEEVEGAPHDLGRPARAGSASPPTWSPRRRCAPS